MTNLQRSEKKYTYIIISGIFDDVPAEIEVDADDVVSLSSLSSGIHNQRETIQNTCTMSAISAQYNMSYHTN